MSEEDRLPPEVYESWYFECKRLAIDLGYPDHCKISYAAWMAEEIERLRAENKSLLTCSSVVGYNVFDVLVPCLPAELEPCNG